MRGQRTPQKSEVGQQIRQLNANTGMRLVIDEDCLGCGWPERWFNGTVFGCNKCDHTGKFRDQ